MTRLLVLLLVCATFVLGLPTAHSAEYQAGGGLQYSIMSGNDFDNGIGGYGYVEQSINEYVKLRLTLSYITGDFKGEQPPADTYTSLGFEGAMLFQYEYDAFTPYAGIGIGFFVNDLESDSDAYAPIDNCFGISIPAGVTIRLTETVGLDLGLKYLFVQPDSEDFKVLNMDTLALSAGVSFKF